MGDKRSSRPFGSSIKLPTFLQRGKKTSAVSVTSSIARSDSARSRAGSRCEDSDERPRSASQSQTNDAFKLFSQNILVDPENTRVNIKWKALSFNYTIVYECSVVENIEGILEKLENSQIAASPLQTEPTEPFDPDPSKYILCKRDYNTVGNQILLDPEYPVSEYGLKQGDELIMKHIEDIETLDIELPATQSKVSISYNYQKTVTEVIKELKTTLKTGEGVYGLYDARIGMWLDNSKTMFTYDLTNQRIQFRALANEFVMRILLADHDQKIGIKVLPSFKVSDIHSIIKFQLNNRKLAQIHQGRYGIFIDSSKKWMRSTTSINEYAEARTETVVFKVKHQVCSVIALDQKFSILVDSTVIVNDVIELLLARASSLPSLECDIYTIYNANGDRHNRNQEIWNILKEMSANDSLFIRASPFEVMLSCEKLYPSLKLNFEMDPFLPFTSFTASISRKFGIPVSQISHLKDLIRNKDMPSDIAVTHCIRSGAFLSVELFELEEEIVRSASPTVVLKEASTSDTENKFNAFSLTKLVEKLTDSQSEGSTDYLDFFKTFLLTYQSFTDAKELIVELQKRYCVMNTTKQSWKDFETYRKTIQLRVCNVLSQWIKKYPFDFLHLEQGLSNCNAMLKFVDDIVSEENMSLAKQIRKNLLKLRDTVPQPQAKKTQAKVFFINEKVLDEKDDVNAMVFACTAETIAGQLTLIEWALFSQIMVSKINKPNEILNGAWSKKDAHTRAPRIVALSKRFNAVARWVVQAVLELKTPKARGERMTKLIDVASHLVQKNNYSTLMALIAGLNNACMARLKASIKEMSSKAVKVIVFHIRKRRN